MNVPFQVPPRVTNCPPAARGSRGTRARWCPASTPGSRTSQGWMSPQQRSCRWVAAWLCCWVPVTSFSTSPQVGGWLVLAQVGWPQKFIYRGEKKLSLQSSCSMGNGFFWGWKETVVLKLWMCNSFLFRQINWVSWTQGQALLLLEAVKSLAWLVLREGHQYVWCPWDVGSSGWMCNLSKL